MQQYYNDQILYSPSDLVTFLGCHHASFLDVKALLEIPCGTVKQIKLVNAFCWLDVYANKNNLKMVNAMKKIFPYLTYAGAIPFVFCAACLGLEIQQVPVFGSVKTILSVYGLGISSFLAGAHWGQHLHINKSEWARFLPIFSNVIAVLLWLGFLVLSFTMQMAMFVAAFVALLIIDHRLFQMDIIIRHYFKTRFFVSAIVIISLIISGIAS